LEASSEEYWTMSASLIQLRCNEEDKYLRLLADCKLNLFGVKNDGPLIKAPANFRASSRGKTDGAGVILRDWALNV